jgi:RHS repeat-associated protein
MRVARLLLSALLVVIATCVPAALAQAPGPEIQQGMTPYASFQGGEIDSVNLGSGNVVIHIPLVSYPQRGDKLRLAFKFFDTNKGWYIYNNGRVAVWTFSTTLGHTAVPNPWVGPDQGMRLGYSTVKWTDDFDHVWTIRLNTAITADGSSHEILTSDPRLSKPGWSSDATGIHFNGDVTYPAFLDNDGVQYTAPTTVTGPGNVIDPNGNEITYGANGWTDTLGRVLPGYPTSGATTAPGVSSSTTNCPSGTVSALQWNVPATNGTTVPYKFCYANFNYQTHFGYSGVNEASGTSTLISAIVLPNLTTWIFNYDSYLNISLVIFPTGGYTSYTWTTRNIYPASRIVASRTVNAADGTGAHTWNYAWNDSAGQVIVTDPLLNDTVVTASYGYVTQTQSYSGSHSSGTLLKTVSTQYHMETDPMSNYTTANAAVNVVPLSQTVTWANGQTMQTTTTFDSGFQYGIYNFDGTMSYYNAYYGLPVNQTASDYGQGAAGSTLKQTNTVYYWQNNSTYVTADLLNLPQTVKVLDGSGNTCAETDYAYDNPSYLTASGISTQHISVSGPRGNVSSVTRQLTNTPCTASPSWQPIASYIYSYDTGTVPNSIDPLNHATARAYSASFAGAYATTVTNALSQSANHNYDFNTGLLTSTTDPNLLQTSFSFDSMFRLSQVNHPDGAQDTITHQESIVPFTATLTKQINSAQSEITTNVFDGLGRVTQSQLTSDPQGTVYTDTTYDALGRVATVSNPYRNGTDITTTTGTTIYGYDALGRKISETYPDNSVLTTAYCGPSTLVTDPTGKWRRSRVDGLGRLVEVDEPNAPGASVNSNGCPGTGEPIWVTTYGYDPLGNLTSVVQNGSHQRTFTHDSLSRLLTASNPETGTITYAYNNDGVLISKTDARGITTNYSPSDSPIDVLHRVTKVTYSNGDPSITFAYDQANCLGLSTCQNIGLRTSVTDAAGSEAWSSQVDAANHRSVHVDQRTTNSSPSNITKTSTYYLDFAGNVTQAVYPTGRVVNYTYDSANRPSTATDSSNGITYAAGPDTSPGGTCLADVTCYTPQGTFYALSIGETASFTGLNLTHIYNSRLQPSEFKASSTGGNAIDISYNFVDPVSGKNAGHVYGITNNLDSTRSQTFSYDQLNRITAAQTTSTYATSPSHCWAETYSLDPWGNLQSLAGGNSQYNGCTYETGFTKTADGNNHLSGFSYDTSGNTTADGYNSYTWNAESQLKVTAGSTYLYDGDGRRVAKANTAAPPVPYKLYWYGSGGDILAETDASGNTTAEYIFFGSQRIAMLPASGTPIYYVEDLLGTSRVTTTSTGVVCYDADFYPYGGERFYTNTCPQNYKFEGKERDAETGNDDFGARYYSNRFGRWLSADWSSVPTPVPYANVSNPQTLNLYSMVLDDPESFADLLGHEGGYYYAPDGRMIAPGDPNYPESAHPIRDTVLLGLGTIAALAGPAGGVIARNLLGWGLATAPVSYPIVVDTIEALSPGSPGSLTISSTTRLSAQEVSAGSRYAAQTGTALAESLHKGEEFVDAAKKTYDVMQPGPSKFWTGSNAQNFMERIMTHLSKVDKTIIDLKGASKDQVKAIKAFVKTLTKAEQKKIDYVH